MFIMHECDMCHQMRHDKDISVLQVDISGPAPLGSLIKNINYCNDSLGTDGCFGKALQAKEIEENSNLSPDSTIHIPPGVWFIGSQGT